MEIFQVIITLVIVGIIMYVVNNVIPMVGWMKTVINALVAILILIWLLQVFGYGAHLPRGIFRR